MANELYAIGDDINDVIDRVDGIYCFADGTDDYTPFMREAIDNVEGSTKVILIGTMKETKPDTVILGVDDNNKIIAVDERNMGDEPIFQDQVKVTESARDDAFQRTIDLYTNNYGYEMFKQQDGITALVNKTRDTRGPVGVIFKGKSSKPISGYVYPGEDGMERFAQAVDRAISNAKARAESDAKRKEQRKLTRDHDVKVGDIYYTSWGYDQTNIDYYEVVNVRGSRIDLKELHADYVGHSGQEDMVTPVAGQYKDDKVYTVSARADGTLTPLSSFEYLSKWDGKPKYQTDAYSGH